MKAYKLFRIKNDKLYPLFINRAQEIPLGVELTAEMHVTSGFAPRKGWHCTFVPFAPHLKRILKSGERRVWVECEVSDIELYNRPESQGGTWILADKLTAIRIIDEAEIDSLVSWHYYAGVTKGKN